MSIRIVWFLMLLALAACARSVSTAMAPGTHPASAGGPSALPLHSLAVFGTFDASTTVPEVSRTNGWWLTEEFIQDGFIPISYESDGDVWIISLTAGPAAPVYLYSLTARERIVAADTMADFLTGCKVSEEED